MDVNELVGELIGMSVKSFQYGMMPVMVDGKVVTGCHHERTEDGTHCIVLETK